MTYSVLGLDTQTGQRVEIPKTSRLQGLYIIGLQGYGKSGLIENLIIQDIRQQIGVCVLDPHGELVDHVIARLPDKEVEEKVIYLDLTDYTYPFGLNLFECADPTEDSEIVQTLSHVLHVFEKAYGISWNTPLMYDLLYNSAYTLIANHGYSMIDIRLLLTNEACRKRLVQHISNYDVLSFWNRWDDPKQKPLKEQQEDSQTILNKLNDFSHAPLRNIVGQSSSSINFQDIMNEGKILLVKLNRRLENPSSLIGSIIIAQLLNAAYDRPTHKRKQFNLYADEFQNFATEDFATLLEEARKYAIGTTIAHQNRGQLDTKNGQLETNLKDRTRSVANLVMFKINSKDAAELAGEFDCTPARTKKVLKQRTEPKYREWVEYFWDSDAEEQKYNELEQRLKDIWKQRDDGICQAIGSLAFTQHLRNAFHSSLYGTESHYDYSSLEDTVKQAEKEADKKKKEQMIDYLFHPFRPFWFPIDGTFKHYSWSDDQKEAIARNLTLVDVKSETVKAYYYYSWENKNGTFKQSRLDYTYVKRVEWYTPTGEAAISGVEYALRHQPWPEIITTGFPNWDGVWYEHLRHKKEDLHALFRHLLEMLSEEVHNLVTPYNEIIQLKLYLDLAPDLEPLRVTTYKRDEIPPTLSYPPLATIPQPEIGQRRDSYQWLQYGRWAPYYFQEIPELASWLVDRKKSLNEQLLRYVAKVDIYEKLGRQLLDEQKEIKHLHYQAVNRTEYLGEQPVKEQHTQVVGERSTRFGQVPIERITDVPWYDQVEELDQTHDQRRDEIANELSNLPMYTARVKITIEEKPLEHIIKTLDPKQQPDRPLFGQALQERLARIKEQNIQDGYIREKAKVEEEIHLRQVQFREPPEEPPISRRQPRQ